MGDRVVDRAKLRMSGKKRKNEDFRDDENGIDGSRCCCCPARAGSLRKQGEKKRQPDPHGDISSRLVKLHVPGGLLHEEHLSHDRQASDVKKKRLQASKGDFVVFCRPVHGGQSEEHDPDRDTAKTKNKQGVGRAHDFDVEAVGVMPPVIEGRRGEHGNTSPAREKNT